MEGGVPEPKIKRDMKALKNALKGRDVEGNEYSGPKKWAWILVLFYFFIAPAIAMTVDNWPINSFTFYNCFNNDEHFGKALLVGFVLAIVSFYLRYKVEVEGSRDYYSKLVFRMLFIMPLEPIALYFLFGTHHNPVSLMALGVGYFVLLIFMGLYVALQYTLLEHVNDSLFEGGYFIKAPFGAFIIGFFFIVYGSFLCGVNGVVNA